MGIVYLRKGVTFVLLSGTKTTNQMKTYKVQNKEVQDLLKRISIKSKNFAKQTTSSPYFGDLLSVIDDLKSIDSFLNDKYLTK